MRHKMYSLVGLAATALMLAGCSSAPTKVDTVRIDSGPIHARTFNFISPRPQTEPAIGNLRETVHEMVQAAITRDLAARGVSRVPTGGDITVEYLMILGNKTSMEALNDYFSDEAEAQALLEKAQAAYTNNKNPDSFEASTLVIEIIDPKDSSRLKRNYATRPLLNFPTKEARAENIQRAVDETLKNLKIEP